ncbi:MAG: hypothetical protein CMP63_04925 [Flavobacteriales bacterium]|nr:hypothetical protein [Flavobacteriales bacterium]|tara:strand:- start:4316 stop:5239 length:924 start_codon:yes stop_codon:yes gene_type:complete
MTKKQFYIRAFLFVLITGCFLFSIEKIITLKMKNVKSDYVGKINKVLNGNAKEDITIWGASTAEGNIVPKIISDSTKNSVFNLGLDGTNLNQYIGLLKYYIKKTPPKTIILAADIHGALMRRKAIYRNYDWIHSLDCKEIYEALYTIDKEQILKAEYIPFYNLLLYGKHNLKYFKTDFGSYKYPMNGFVERNGIITSKVNEQRDKIKLSNDLTVLEQYKSIIDLAHSYDHEIYIVITPCYIEGLKMCSNYQNTIRLIQNLSLNNAKVLDYSNHEMNQERHLFKDNTHLNKSGAIKFSSILAKDLTKK